MDTLPPPKLLVPQKWAFKDSGRSTRSFLIEASRRKEQRKIWGEIEASTLDALWQSGMWGEREASTLDALGQVSCYVKDRASNMFW